MRIQVNPGVFHAPSDEGGGAESIGPIANMVFVRTGRILQTEIKLFHRKRG